jgi:hypothetical protein
MRDMRRFFNRLGFRFSELCGCGGLQSRLGRLVRPQALLGVSKEEVDPALARMVNADQPFSAIESAEA